MRQALTVAITGYIMLWSAAALATPYFEADRIPPTLLTPPPAAHSERWNRDIDEILKIQASLDEKEMAEARAEQNLTPEMVAEAVDPALTRKTHPALYRLLDRTFETTHDVNKRDKDYWNTKRPHVSDSRVKGLINTKDTPAYPSGHTSVGHAMALVLGQLIPEKSVAFYARAEEISQHRVIAGMHYPHDIDGGRQVALMVTGGLMQTSAFRKDFAAAKAELAKKK